MRFFAKAAAHRTGSEGNQPTATHAAAGSLGTAQRPGSKRRLPMIVLFGSVLTLAILLGTGIVSAAPPTVIMGTATEASYTSVHVTGEVDLGGLEGEYLFEVSTDGSLWEQTNARGPVTGAASVEGEIEEVEGLPVKPGTTYSVRLTAYNFEEFELITSAGPNPEFTTLPVAPPTVTLHAPDQVTGTSARFSATIVPGTPAGDPSAFAVDWEFHCEPECPGELKGHIAPDSTTTEVNVEATTHGLVVGAGYEVTLVATNAGGATIGGPEPFATPPTAPAIAGLTARPWTDEAELVATVNPGGLQTTYQFEYGPTATYGNVSRLTTLPSGGIPVAINAKIGNLATETTYHFSLVVINSLGTTRSADQTFTTQLPAPNSASCPNALLREENNSVSLPDCRAYEKVSPAEKSDQGVSFNHSGSSASGNAISFAGLAAFGGSEATGITNAQYVGTRGEDGWSVHPLYLPSAAPASGLLLPAIQRISPDAAEGAIVSGTPSIPGAPAGVNNLYLRNAVTGATRLVSTASPPNPGPNYGPEFGAASSDFNHVAFTAKGALTAGAPESVDNVYRWDEGRLQLASILPDGAPAAEGAAVAPQNVEPNRRAMSSDGSRLFFAAGPGVEGGLNPASIYLRQGDATTEITTSQRASSLGEPGSGIFATASPDGVQSFFTSSDELTNGAVTPPPGSSRVSDLYRYDAGTRVLTDLTPAPGGAGVQGVVGDASDDGSYVYFVASAQLDGVEGTAGANNLYVWHQGDSVRFIATLSNREAEGLLWTSLSRTQSSRLVTPDGHHLVFNSAQPLSDYANEGFEEVYAYNALNGSLNCVSCDPSGAPATGSAALAQVESFEAIGQSRRVIDDTADRVFFDSSDALVAGDSNGVQDVYEWEAEGTGSCASASQNGGCIYLISSGTSPQPASFADAGADGRDVFFTTTSRLTAGDEDSLSDLYDARVDGGFPSPAKTPPCSGEACRGPGAPGVSAPSVGTMSFAQPSAPSLKAPASRSIKGKAGSLKVTVSEAGKLVWSGSGLVKRSSYLKKAGTATIKFGLSRAAARTLTAKGAYRTTLKLTFDGAAGRSVKRLVGLTFSSPQAKSTSKTSKRVG